ncbi:Fur family transcriptional regulator [Thermopirellula anaerolimosa]
MQSGEIARRLRELEAACRSAGRPLTVQRRGVFEALLMLDNHPTADEVLAAVRNGIPNISRTTVYRILDDLVQMGVVRRIHHPGSAARYDGKIVRHHHLVCTACGKVWDWEDPRLDRIPAPRDAAEFFEVHDFSVYFSGVCNECLKLQRGDKSGRP